MSSSPFDAAAIVQGVAAAVVLVGLVGLYLDRMSSISSNIESLSESVDSLNDEVSAVNLADMERDLTRMISKVEFVANGLAENSTPPTGQGTVYTELDDTGLTVGISYVTTQPRSHGSQTATTEGTSAGDGGPETVVEFEFDEEINMRALGDRLEDDDSVAEAAERLFGREIAFEPSSPFEFVVHFPTDDGDAVAEFLPQYLDRVDEHVDAHRAKKQSFESRIEDGL